MADPIGHGFPTNNDFATLAGIETLTNKTISGASNSIIDIPEAALSTSIVSQSRLKSTTGEVSTTTTGANTTLPGGGYGFYPQLRSTGADTVGASIASALANTSYVTTIYLSTSAGTSYAQQRYIQASPPYDLGDGEIEQFVFALVNSTGKVVSAYAAPEAPWHNNGPTDIRADYYTPEGRGYRRIKQFFTEHGSVKAALAQGLSREQVADLIHNSPLVDIEITQAIKNADMGLIPHPFGTVPVGHTVVLLDPVSLLMGQLACLCEGGESICELLHSGDLIVTNTEVNRVRPQGVLTTTCRFR